MNEQLYYCRDWKHRSYEDYDICVSDFVENRSGGVLLQIHCAVIKDGKIVRGYKTRDL